MFAGVDNHFCPAGVYDYTDGPDGVRHVVNPSNCLHCKTCDIKDPSQVCNNCIKLSKSFRT